MGKSLLLLSPLCPLCLCYKGGIELLNSFYRSKLDTYAVFIGLVFRLYFFWLLNLHRFIEEPKKFKCILRCHQEWNGNNIEVKNQLCTTEFTFRTWERDLIYIERAISLHFRISHSSEQNTIFGNVLL